LAFWSNINGVAVPHDHTKKRGETPKTDLVSNASLALVGALPFTACASLKEALFCDSELEGQSQQSQKLFDLVCRSKIRFLRKKCNLVNLPSITFLE
jgi:hypothetical protein